MRRKTERSVYRFGDLRIEPHLNQIVREEETLSVEPKTMEVLCILLERGGDVVTLDELLDQVWAGQVVEPGSAQRHIARLRRVLGDDVKSPRFIETIKKRGYRAIAPVTVVGSPASQQPALDVDESGRHAIAILPLENLTPNAEDAYFAAGLHEELLTRLAQIRSFKVISRTSVLEYAGQPKNIRDIARELNVQRILEGTVRRASDNVRISAQLIDAKTDQRLWAQTYDLTYSAENVFAIQNDIATAIVQTLRAELSPSETERLGRVPTRSTAAYDFYLNGNDYFLPWPDDADALPSALKLYERAIEEDPTFAAAHAALSHVHSRFYWVGLDRTERRLEMARQAFERAFELCPELSEAHLAAGEYYYRGFGDYPRALEEYARAEMGLPNSAELAMARAEVYRRMGLWDESLACWKQASELDPRNALPLFHSCATALLRRDYDQAERFSKQGIALRPDFMWAHVPFLRDGDTRNLPESGQRGWMRPIYERDPQALVRYLDRIEIDAVSSMMYYIPKASLYALAHRLADQRDEAKRCYGEARHQVERMLASNPDDPLLLVALGEALAGLGEHRLATEAARRAMALRPTSADAMVGPTIHIDAVVRAFLPSRDTDTIVKELDAYLSGPGAFCIESLLPDPRFDDIRDEPRFRSLVKKHQRAC